MKSKTNVKAKTYLKIVKPKYTVTTFVDKEKKKITRIIEEIVYCEKCYQQEVY